MLRHVLLHGDPIHARLLGLLTDWNLPQDHREFLPQLRRRVDVETGQFLGAQPHVTLSLSPKIQRPIRITRQLVLLGQRLIQFLNELLTQLDLLFAEIFLQLEQQIFVERQAIPPKRRHRRQRNALQHPSLVQIAGGHHLLDRVVKLHQHAHVIGAVLQLRHGQFRRPIAALLFLTQLLLEIPLHH